MIKIISRYLASSFILPFLVGLLFFISFLLTFQIFRLTSLVINKGVPITMIFELLGHIAISFIPMAMPLASLFAMIFAMNKLSGDSEIIVMRSVGFTRLRLYIPFFLISCFVALLTYSLNYSIIPHSKREFKKALILLTSSGFLADIKGGEFFTSIPGLTIYADQVENKGTELHNVFINLRNEKREEENIVVAKSGELLKINPNKWGHASLRLRLFDGNILKKTGADGKMEKILFEKYEFPLSEGEISSGLVTKRSMKTNDELFKQLVEENNKLSRQKRKSAKWLDVRDSVLKTEIEICERFNTPLLCVLFVFLGLGLGIQRTRGASLNAIAVSFIVLAVYYTIYFTAVGMAHKDVIPSYIAVFMPSVLTLGAALFFYRRLEWEA